MLKKAGIVAASAVALSFVAAPAFAATTTHAAPHAAPAQVATQDDPNGPDIISFGDAYRTFIWGGGALGAGAAALVAGAYTGIATTPAEILGSLAHHGH